jgi:Putative transposase
MLRFTAADSGLVPVVTSMAGFAGRRPHAPGGRTAMPAAFRYARAVSRRTSVSCSIRRKDLPEQLAPLALHHQRLLYDLLFRAASETLLKIAADPRHLGARIGILAVLHTCSQNLRLHPHLHCLVPARGLALDNSRWIACRPKFFLPVHGLSRLFRGKLLAFLKRKRLRNPPVR